MKARDARFDGRFFTAVKSTGVYCRPICPARTPKAENCTFYVQAAAAESAGYRPCRRCRPECAPGTPAWDGTSVTVARALRLIHDGALDDHGVDMLAARLGVGDRYLRRLFREQVGVSPAAVASTRRVHFAKRLIEDTDLPMGRVALAAGYRNVRRFNAAIRKSFERTPSEIRVRRRAGQGSADEVTVRVPYRAPFDWITMLRWLSPRAIPGVEEVGPSTYRRTVHVDGLRGIAQVEPAGEGALALRVPGVLTPALATLVRRLRRLFDLDADAQRISEQLGADPRLARAARRHPGVRVPGCWRRFEVAVRIIVGQQVTIAGATHQIGRLTEAFGERLEHPVGGLTHIFPTPRALANADVAALALMPGARARTIRELAQAVAEGQDVLEPAPDVETAVERLRALPGIGDWTAQYIAMRALGEPDAFPSGDLWLRKALAEDGLPTATQVRRRAEAWRPWRAYAAMLLWSAQPDEDTIT